MIILSYIVIGFNLLADLLLVTAPDFLFSAWGIVLWVLCFLMTIIAVPFMWKKDRRIVVGLILTLSPILYNLIVPFAAGIFGYQTIY